MNILNLSDWLILTVEESNEFYRNSAEYTIATSPCPSCVSMLPPYRFGKYEPLFLDAPMHGKHVGIFVQRQRYRCRSCEKTYVQVLPDMDVKRLMTKGLVAYIKQ